MGRGKPREVKRDRRGAGVGVNCQGKLAAALPDGYTDVQPGKIAA